MDVEQIRQLQPTLDQFLARFADCFDRKDTRAHMTTYVQGQLSDLPEKTVDPIATQAGVPARTLQEFLSQHRWQEDRVLDRLREIVLADYGGGPTIGVIDETSDVKKGDKTPGVQPQYCGCVGKTANGIVTVHLGYACRDFHCLLDGELYLPESWANDRERCREAGIPDDMVYRPKWRIALELYDRAVASGVRFDWLTFDEGYGSKPEFLLALDARKQRFVGEVPKSLTGWLERPRVTDRPYRRGGRGRSRKTPRLVAGSRPARSVAELAEKAPQFRKQPWKKWRVKDTDKGPLVWETKHAMLWLKAADGLPARCVHLIVARNVLDPGEVKYFLSNAAEGTSVGTMLLVGFSRWRVERCFQDQKQEIGLDDWEGRRYLGLKRHLILSAVSYLFLATVHQRLRGKKRRTDDLPSADGRRCAGVVMVAG